MTCLDGAVVIMVMRSLALIRKWKLVGLQTYGSLTPAQLQAWKHNCVILTVLLGANGWTARLLSVMIVLGLLVSVMNVSLLTSVGTFRAWATCSLSLWMLLSVNRSELVQFRSSRALSCLGSGLPMQADGVLRRSSMTLIVFGLRSMAMLMLTRRTFANELVTIVASVLSTNVLSRASLELLRLSLCVALVTSWVVIVSADVRVSDTWSIMLSTGVILYLWELLPW